METQMRVYFSIMIIIYWFAFCEANLEKTTCHTTMQRSFCARLSPYKNMVHNYFYLLLCAGFCLCMCYFYKKLEYSGAYFLSRRFRKY